MSNESPSKWLLKHFSWLLRPGMWPILFLVAVFTTVIFDALLGKGQNGMTFLESLWATISQLPTNPIFQIGFIIFAVLSFWQSTKNFRKELEANAEKEATIKKESLGEIQSALSAEFSKLDNLLELVSSKHNAAILEAANAIVAPVADLMAIEDDLMRIRELKSAHESKNVEAFLGQYDIEKAETFATSILIFEGQCSDINAQCQSKWRGDMFPETFPRVDQVDYLVNADHEILKDKVSKRAFFKSKFALEDSMKLLDATIKNLETNSNKIRGAISKGGLFL